MLKGVIPSDTSLWVSPQTPEAPAGASFREVVREFEPDDHVDSNVEREQVKKVDFAATTGSRPRGVGYGTPFIRERCVTRPGTHPAAPAYAPAVAHSAGAGDDDPKWHPGAVATSHITASQGTAGQ